MGGSSGKNLVQWSKGEYPNADNDEDDLKIITNDAVGNPNGFGYRADDHGYTPGKRYCPW